MSSANEGITFHRNSANYLKWLTVTRPVRPVVFVIGMNTWNLKKE